MQLFIWQTGSCSRSARALDAGALPSQSLPAPTLHAVPAIDGLFSGVPALQVSSGQGYHHRISVSSLLVASMPMPSHTDACSRSASGSVWPGRRIVETTFAIGTGSGLAPVSVPGHIEASVQPPLLPLLLLLLLLLPLPWPLPRRSRSGRHPAPPSSAMASNISTANGAVNVFIELPPQLPPAKVLYGRE